MEFYSTKLVSIREWLGIIKFVRTTCVDITQNYEPWNIREILSTQKCFSMPFFFWLTSSIHCQYCLYKTVWELFYKWLIFFLTFRHCLYIPLIHSIKPPTFLVRSHLKTSGLTIAYSHCQSGWRLTARPCHALNASPSHDSSGKIVLSHLKSGSHTFSSHSLHVSTCKTRMQFTWPLSNAQRILHSYLKLRNSCDSTYILAFWISTKSFSYSILGVP